MNDYEIVIKNGTVVDPASEFIGKYNIGISEGKIKTLSMNKIQGKDEIDATELIVSPGFIDIHTHVDGTKSGGEAMVKMGVTSTIGGNCGMFFWFDEEHFKRMEETKQSNMKDFNQLEKDWSDLLNSVDNEGYHVNLGMFVGSQALRLRIGITDLFNPADKSQIAKMMTILKKEMKKGAFGVSFGLAYAPGISRDELVNFFKVVAQFNGIASIHPRGYALGLPGLIEDAISGQEELIEAARISRVKLQIGHIAHQLAFKSKPYNDIVLKGLKMIEDARAEGVDVMADCLPINNFGATVDTVFIQTIFKMLPAVEKTYRMKIDKALEIRDGPYKGQGLTPELYKKLKKEAPLTGIIGHLMKEDLMIQTLIPPYVMISSDVTRDQIPAQAILLGKYVREQQILTLMEGLYKVSTLPARRLGLINKGKIAVGVDADLTIFNPDTINGLYLPKGPNIIEGIHHVIVNGVPVLRDEKITKETPGKSIRHVPWQ